ncbi:hypothetical protein [Chryseobacterium gleum]|uniref:hypothetical protein n=1 Tax=Chryseobacterium gleum TaxID=250 RepID=UPI001E48CEF0|nr:hypothetical protein [Chryseobacterium gleum]MCD9618202.1 hypothetical protein [Chryseobacterium gleum]
MKKKHLIFNILMPFGLFGQSVLIVPDTDNYGQNGIVYNNSLFFSKSNKLVKFDGGFVTAIPEPVFNNQPINGTLSGNMVIYNNKLCYNYDYKVGNVVNEWQNKDFLITYDGVEQNVILNPDAVYSAGGIYIGDKGDENEPIISGGKLFLKGAYYTGGSNSNLYLFNGQNIIKINNANNESNVPTGQIKLGDWALDFNDELYFSYQDSNMSWPGIAKFNGTNIVKLTTDNYKEYWGSIFNLNNQLYFKINFLNAGGGYGIGNYDPVTNVISKISTPSLAFSGEQKPLIHNSQAFITVGNVNLSVFNGLTVNQITNIGTNDKGVVGRRILFGNAIYFPYQDSNYKLLLGKYSGGSISIVPNPSNADQGIGKSLIEFNNNLYFTYKTSATAPNIARSYLAKYDGVSITVYPNPDNGEGVIDNKFIIYGNNLYFPYKNAAGTIVLAKYGNAILNTKEVSNKDYFVYKDNKGFTVVSKAKEIIRVMVMDATGRLISDEKINNLKYYFEIEKIGVYFVKVRLKDGTEFTHKIKK